MENFKMTYLKPGIYSEISLLLQTLVTFSKSSIITPKPWSLFQNLPLSLQTLGTFSKSSIITPNLGHFFKIFHYHSKPWALFQNLPLLLQIMSTFSKIPFSTNIGIKIINKV